MDFLTSSTLKEGALVLLLGTVLVGFIQTCRHIGKRKKKDVGKGNEGCVGSQQTASGCD